MKTRSLILFVFISLFMTSCTTSYFYQEYKTIPYGNLDVKHDYMVYQDDNCKISYNLWKNGGDIGFEIYNKTDEDIYLNMSQSYFVINGIAYNYYKNRVYTSSNSTGVISSNSKAVSTSVTGINYFNLGQTNNISAASSAGIHSSSAYSVSYEEPELICIPSRTSKIISEYNINKYLFRDCKLYKYPNKRQINTINFEKNDSPIVFSNRISYSVGGDGKKIEIENKFYVSEITNYPKTVFLTSRYDVYCDQKSNISTKYFIKYSADKFYIKYSKKDSWKH